MTLRRFEMYSLRDGASAAGVARLREALRDCGSFIPEVLHSAVGSNVEPTGLHLVWEHAYASDEAYRRYMVHPFHAAVLDRFLLADSPERVTSDNGLGAGLVGYACDGAPFAVAAGVRRVVLLRLADDAEPARVEAFAGALRAVPLEARQMRLSVFAANTLATRWFDGVSPIGGAPAAWSHVWEQGFATLADTQAYLDGSSAPARAERAGWAGWDGGLVRRALQVTYRLEPGRRA